MNIEIVNKSLDVLARTQDIEQIANTLNKCKPTQMIKVAFSRSAGQHVLHTRINHYFKEKGIKIGVKTDKDYLYIWIRE